MSSTLFFEWFRKLLDRYFANAQVLCERSGELTSDCTRTMQDSRRLRAEARTLRSDARTALSPVSPPPPPRRSESGDTFDVIWLPHVDRELESVASCSRCRVPLFPFPADASELLVCRTCGFVSRQLTPARLPSAKKATKRRWLQQRKERRRPHIEASPPPA